MAAHVDLEQCIGCQACVGVCPVEAIAMNSDKAKVDPKKCIDCGACVGECPVQAIELQ